MEYTSDSDLSEDTRELVNEGLASVKRKRRVTMAQSDGVHERFLDSNMDTSNVCHPSGRGVSIGDTSIHSLAAAGIETANSQNHNIYNIYSIKYSLVYSIHSARLCYIQ